MGDAILVELSVHAYDIVDGKKLGNRSKKVVKVFSDIQVSNLLLDHADLRENGIYFLGAHLEDGAHLSFGLVSEEARRLLLSMIEKTDDRKGRNKNGEQGWNQLARMLNQVLRLACYSDTTLIIRDVTE